MTTFQIWLLGGVIAGLFTIVVLMLKHYLSKSDNRSEKVFNMIESIGVQIVNIRLDLTENYVKKEELEKFETKNENGHKDLRQDILKYVAEKKHGT